LKSPAKAFDVAALQYEGRSVKVSIEKIEERVLKDEMPSRSSARYLSAV